MKTKILTIPGYCGSGDNHWQSIWETERNNIQRVEQDNWDKPDLTTWVQRLDSYIKNEQRILLVGHSLACSLISHWALAHDSSSVVGALLVSPADVNSTEHTPDAVRNFAPMPLVKLPFKSIVVASLNNQFIISMVRGSSVDLASFTSLQYHSFNLYTGRVKCFCDKCLSQFFCFW